MAAHATPDVSLARVARYLSSNGVSILPIGSLSTKAPAVASWKEYTIKAASPEYTEHWFAENGSPAAPGMGIVCGKVSGGLTVIDFDTDADHNTLFHAWLALVQQFAPNLFDRLPVVSTPSGGFHVYFRSDIVEGNTKLARTRTQGTLIETRGEGGYVVAPPSPGYELAQCKLSDIPHIGDAERTILLNAAKSLDETPIQFSRQLSPGEVMPGATYNMQATLESVCSLLARHGWKILASTGQQCTLRRPGKTEGTSGTVSVIQGVPIFYSFSTNSDPLPSQKGVDPFGVYAYLEHGGDFRAAAAAIGGVPALLGHQAPQLMRPVEVSQKYHWRDVCMAGADLMALEIRDIAWVVGDVIPSGLTLIAGSPKSGKSLLGWSIALDVVTGQKALGTVEVKRRPVLYMFLEDGKRIVQKRISRMVGDVADLSMLTVAERWRKLDQGGTEDIVEYCQENPDALVVIDTYESLRGDGLIGRDAYRNDYGALKPLSEAVHEHGLNVLIIHHTNKRNGEDPFVSINGSNGISGVADTLGILQRRNDSMEAVLHLRGRELDADQKLALDFDPETGRHTLIGECGEVGVNGQQHAIIAFLRSAAGPVGPTQIAQGVGRENNPALRMQLGRMVDSGVLDKSDYGLYTVAPGPEHRHSSNTHPAVDTTGLFPPVETAPMSVTPVALSPQEYKASIRSTAPDSKNGVIRPLQEMPCPSCGKMWTKEVVQSTGEVRCRRCGVGIAPPL